MSRLCDYIDASILAKVAIKIAVITKMFNSWNARRESKALFFSFLILPKVTSFLKIVRKIWRFSSSILFSSISNFLTKKSNGVTAARQHIRFFYFKPTPNGLFSNCIKLYWHCISSSWNVKVGSNFYTSSHPKKKLLLKSTALLRLNFLKTW